jgi:hypothetical protein
MFVSGQQRHGPFEGRFGLEPVQANGGEFRSSDHLHAQFPVVGLDGFNVAALFIRGFRKDIKGNVLAEHQGIASFVHVGIEGLSFLFAGNQDRFQGARTVEFGMAKGADTGLRLGPFAKTEIIELALKAREFLVLEVFRQDFVLQSLHTEQLNRCAVHGPRDDRRIFRRENRVQVAEEFGDTRAAFGFQWVHIVWKERWLQG